MSSPASEGPLNRLARETSPYLQQHARNPVDWYAWGEEALRKAKELDRPIFLSIGYSSCHWCHVMERESFENEEIARILNEHYISIKVDREERPDLDAIYMTAVQQLTGRGGWPMSVFLTPDLKPFYGGTYFPPDDRQGLPGFPRILLQIAEIYRTRRDQVEQTAEALTRHLGEEGAVSAERGLPDGKAIEEGVRHAKRTYDPHHGGFGPAPKFPRSIELSNLLRYHARTGDPEVLRMVEGTLEGMARGGMYDQVGGGFHRYSTDARWLVPHFEKMLYDNALLARTYLEAFQATKNDFYRQVTVEILEYVLREMTGPEGGFYSATDADSEGEEGKFFVWTPEGVEAVLGREDARVVCEHLGITPGGNFEHGASVPHAAKDLDSVARALKKDPEEVRRIASRGREALYGARESREKPFRDEKVLASWNGLMISAFARAYQALEDGRFLEAATRAAALVLGKMRPDGRLHRTYKDGQARVPGYLDDHAYMGEALLDLYEAGFDPKHLESARELADALLEHFLDPAQGGFFFTAGWHESLIVRKRDDFDGATPSGNGVAALNLLRLERLTGEARCREAADKLFQGVKPLLERVPMAFGYTLLALDFRLHPPVEIAIVGDLGSPAARELFRTVHGRFLPGKVLAASRPPIDERLARAIPLLAGKSEVDGQPAAHVCRDFACRRPVTSPRELAESLESAARG